MPEKNERYDAFAVPRNFGEDGISFNGLSRRIWRRGVSWPLQPVILSHSTCRQISLCVSSFSALYRCRFSLSV